MDLDYIKETTVVDTMLTTYDNPFNPFDNYDEWLRWDSEQGYTDDALDEVEVAQLHATAINYIIDEGPIEDVWTVCKPDTSTPIRLPTS